MIDQSRSDHDQDNFVVMCIWIDSIKMCKSVSVCIILSIYLVKLSKYSKRKNFLKSQIILVKKSDMLCPKSPSKKKLTF